MGKQKQEHATKPTKGKAPPAKKPAPSQTSRKLGKLSIPLVVRGKGKGGKTTLARPSAKAIGPRDDANLQQVVGVPAPSEIQEAVGQLDSGNQKACRRLLKLLANHLGSHAAARLWLATPVPGFVTTPLDEVRKGRAQALLEMLESQWGPSPTYA